MRRVLAILDSATMAVLLLMAAAALAAPSSTPPSSAPPSSTLPRDTLSALRQAGVPPDAISVVVHDASTGQRVLQWQAAKAVNPASLMKLLTTQAALERLGPAWTWATPVWLTGPISNGVLDGSVFIRGSGDPRFSLERVWLLLRKLQQQGVREIRGDIVLDASAFAPAEGTPADFDGEPLRPYNLRPAALLFQQRTVVYSFVPDIAAGVARVQAEPALLGSLFDRTVPLAGGPCDDWRAALKPTFEPGRARFAGAYPTSCGELNWPVADPQPATYEARLIDTLWREMGGLLHGAVRDGTAPLELKPTFEQRSPALAELVREINKTSNNPMAQQLFLTLALNAQPRVPATADGAREVVLRWLAERTGAITADDDVLIDNGSGLSRHTRISAQRLAQVLLLAWDGPLMSELMSSLPVSGLDGTLRRSRVPAGRAHLKTGSLRDVAAVAGYVLSNSGKRYVLVAMINHPQAGQARAALDALVRWTLQDVPIH